MDLNQYLTVNLADDSTSSGSPSATVTIKDSNDSSWVLPPPIVTQDLFLAGNVSPVDARREVCDPIPLLGLFEVQST
jgi:hypothetical protein